MREGATQVNGLWEDGSLIHGKVIGSDFEYEGRILDGRPHGLGHLRTGTNYFY
jgi:hypothetical protein